MRRAWGVWAMAAGVVLAMPGFGACGGAVDDPDRGAEDADAPDEGADATTPEADAVLVEDGVADAAADVPALPVGGDPGRVTLHRLNRVEYDNTVRDLLGTAQRPGRDFPSDDHGYGFDNIADVLAMSPLLFELYENAAEKLIDEAMFQPVTEPVTFLVEAEDAQHTVGGPSGGAWNLWSNGEASEALKLPADGTYRMRVRLWGQQAGPDPVHVALSVDGLTFAEVDVTATAAAPEVVEVTFEAKAGLRQVAVAFTNDFYDPVSSADRNLLVDWFEVYGPLEVLTVKPVNAARERIMVCDPAAIGEVACARQIVAAFGQRAWRRPLTEAEVDAVAAFLAVAQEEGEGFEAGVRLALQAILTSPHFVFRVEVDPDPTGATPRPLTDWELASRLSYFLWSSMPDDALFEAAKAGRLQDPAELEAQVRRMLKDPRATALVDNFAGQWLYLRAIDDAAPDPWVYPAWSEALREAMRAEAWLFVNGFLRGDRDMRELLTATESHIDATLAEHYGIAPFSAPPGAFVPTDVSAFGRGGLLRQGALLTALSYPTRTSPVKRGKWVLGQLLCSEPDPPPPGVENITPEALASKTLREIMEIHRADPLCASCHVLMDPIGLGLEHFDGLGVWRETYTDSGLPVDATGTLPGLGDFADADGLLALLADSPAVSMCIVEKTLTYALGRGPLDGDKPYLKALTQGFEVSGRRFSDLVVLLVQSEPFRMRRGQLPGDTQDSGE